MSNNMGGPAFPYPYEHGNTPIFSHIGMSLWDYYAAAALTGIEASQTPPYLDSEQVAKDAAAIADAMLAERAKRMDGKG